MEIRECVYIRKEQAAIDQNEADFPFCDTQAVFSFLDFQTEIPDEEWLNDPFVKVFYCICDKS